MSGSPVDFVLLDRSSQVWFGRPGDREGGWQTLALIQDSPAIRLELDSRPESVTLVRSVLAALGDALALELELLDDLKTAISEACNNVVLHAYCGDVGPMLVELAIGPDGVQAVVGDHGGGIKHAASSEERMGVGLAVISALADRAEFLSAPEGGTTVRMSFAGGSGSQTGGGVIEGGAPRSIAELRLSGDVVATVTPVTLLGRVLGRAARATAARAHFTVDRFSDLSLITDALGAHAVQSADGEPIGFSIASTPRRLELAIGPLRAGTGAGLFGAEAGRRPTAAIGLLADELRVEPVDNHELLRVLFADRSRD
jgi:serine/threonine-protein kinase RsbW